MSNQLADFLRNEISLNERALKLGAAPRVRTQKDYEFWFLKAADEIDRLEAECFTLAAGACEHRGGDDYGNPFCLMSKTPIGPSSSTKGEG